MEPLADASLEQQVLMRRWWGWWDLPPILLIMIMQRGSQGNRFRLIHKEGGCGQII
jgi:hypothetical protein